MALFNRIKVWGAGEVVTATDLNGEFNNLLAGFTPGKIDGLSLTTAAMQTAVSPGSTGAESPAGNLGDEITRLRYVAQATKGTANWYTPLLDSSSNPISLQSLYTQLQGFLGNLMPPGLVAPYGGATAPSGWLLCDGTAYTRTGTYANLFTAIGTAFGYGDNSTTFNVPDLRYMFIRGTGALLNSTGSGTVAGPNYNATFNGHGLRTGMRILFTGGAIGSSAFSTAPLQVTFSFVRVIDANTLQFYNSVAQATAIGSTSGLIAFTGANTATIQQAQDPDVSSHFQQMPGGATTGIGSGQRDALPYHVHNTPSLLSVSSSSNNGASGVAFSVVNSITNNYSSNVFQDLPSMLGLAGSTVAYESRPLSTTMNYIIRY